MMSTYNSCLGGCGNEQKALAAEDDTFYDDKQFASFLRRAYEGFMECLLSHLRTID